MRTHKQLILKTALAWIKDARLFLEEHSDSLLSDADTCDYFRKKTKQGRAPTIPRLPETKPETKQAIKKIDLPAPIAPPLPLPKIVETPPQPILHAVKQEEPTLPQKKPTSFLRALFTKIAPEIAIFSEVPNDAIAKKIATRWKTKNQIEPITVLYYQENHEQKELLAKIVSALDVYFGPAKLLFAEPIEQEKEWKTFLFSADLKLVITCDYTLWQLQNLCQFYKETPAQKTRQLGEKPLFMLPDLSLYLKDPLLKRSLWKALCQTISSLPSPSTKK